MNYEPNSWGDAGGPRESAQLGFRSFAAPEAGDKLRVRAESFADHYSQARQFFVSQTANKQKHLGDALVFELSKVGEPATGGPSVLFDAVAILVSPAQGRSCASTPLPAPRSACSRSGHEPVGARLRPAGRVLAQFAPGRIVRIDSGRLEGVADTGLALAGSPEFRLFPNIDHLNPRFRRVLTLVPGIYRSVDSHYADSVETVAARIQQCLAVAALGIRKRSIQQQRNLSA